MAQPSLRSAGIAISKFSVRPDGFSRQCFDLSGGKLLNKRGESVAGNWLGVVDPSLCPWLIPLSMATRARLKVIEGREEAKTAHEKDGKSGLLWTLGPLDPLTLGTHPRSLSRSNFRLT